MSHEIDAIYEDGVLRPLQPLHLQEHERVRVAITSISTTPRTNQELLEYCAKHGNSSITIEEVRAMLSAIPGNLTDAIREDRDARG